MVVYRASRLEALLDPLAHLLDSQRPEHPLAPQTLIAAHPGMKHWLVGALARRQGAGGIVANLDVVLPSAWLDSLAGQVLGEQAVALQPYRGEHLRWRIHASLDSIDSDELRAYLQGGDAERRRFQLADRLARLYARYLVYRPDWLDAWARGAVPPRDPTLRAGFIEALWRRLRRQIGLPHRGEVLERLVDAIGQYPDLVRSAEPLHVFGLSHLAPAELALLRAVSRHRPLVLYIPDPCRERWAGLSSDRRLLRERVRADAFAPDTEALFLDQDHPLLAQWGRLGQHFMLALEDSEADVVQDVRHWRDEAGAEHEVDDAEAGDSRLHRLQDSLRRLEPALLSPVGDVHAQRADASLRVHVCHTRLRELEVLRDALLQQRRERPDLRPSDIIVMAPDIRTYLPLLPAVFGPPGHADGPLPYHLADVAVASSHSLFDTFRRLLDVPRSRLTAPEVIDLLARPDIARRFGLAADDIDLVAKWLGDARVAWALDAGFRHDLGLPRVSEHTFAWGVDRMLAGYVLGDAAGDDGVCLPDGSELAPIDGIHGPQAAALGALDALLVELADLHSDRNRRTRASAWAQRFEHRLDAMLRVDPDDRLALDAKALLLGFVRTIATEPAQSGLDPELPFDVVRDLLLERLEAAPQRQAFLMGGMTVCGMVPQRSIPFRVIAVIGLNEGEFPRGGGEGGLDPMSRHRRLGDRDLRGDDRYLFLETVMSARDALHLSYVGEGVRDGKPRNPSAPLGELLAAFERAAGVDAEDDAPDAAGAWQRPWLVRHPLQPFDARYFDGRDPALFSFRRDFAQMAAPPAAPPPAPFHTPPTVPVAIAPSIEPIALHEVLGYYRDPARQLLAGALRLRLDALGDGRLPDCEPLEARFDAIDGVTRRVFVHAIAHDALPDAAPPWLRLGGLLPPGRIGEAAWRAECEKVQSLLEGARRHPLFASGLPQACAVSVDIDASPFRVRGELPRCYETDDAVWVFDLYPGRREDALDFRARIGLFVEWALLRLRDAAGDRAARLCALTETDSARWQQSINEWDAQFMAHASDGDIEACAQRLDALRARVGRLLDFWVQAQAAPSWYFPKTSWVAATAPAKTADAWLGGRQHVGERDYGLGYARLLASERDFRPGTADHELLESIARDLHGLIHFAERDAEATA
ncbi:RecBCD enzyme subunit RecC [Lysobacter bugurensis]|uniref:RecBCD enzyme subunit RecC n=1 Tax=Cognatilysobacter bugurensis TaxID=543356 RepID=A0A918SWX2_9GAMM|nr:RecBCD enzyme subunit RecC [Lysobacter bugurensis]